MELLHEIPLESEDRFVLYLLKKDVGFRATNIKRDQAGAEKRQTGVAASPFKRIHFFDKGNGVYALLYFEPDSTDLSRRLARAVVVRSQGNEQWRQRLRLALEEFRDDRSLVLTRKDRALLLLHETMTSWSSDTKEGFESAILLADQALSLDPTLTRALNCKGSSQAWLDDNEAAISTYLEAIRTDSRCVRPWLNLGNRHSKHRMTDRALFAYRIGVDKPPFWDGDNKLQANDARRLVGTGGRTAETDFLLAARNQEIDELFSHFDDLKDVTHTAEVVRGVKLGRKGQWDKALDAFLRAVAQHPNDIAALNNSAHALNQLGRSSEAIAYCDRALKLKPGSLTMKQTRTEALLLLGRIQEALDGFNALASVEPNNPAVNYYKALIEDHMEFIPEAVTTFRRLLLDPLESCDSQCQYAGRRIQELLHFNAPDGIEDSTFVRQQTHQRRRHVTELLDCGLVSATIASSPRLDKAIRAFLSGKPGVAMDHFQAKLAADPFCTAARCGMALALSESDQLEDIARALEYCEQVLSRDESHLDALVLKADTLLREARLRGAGLDPEHPLCAQALECYNRAATIDARHSGVLYWKALAEDAMGLTDVASKTFRQFVVVTPDTLGSHLQYARTRLHHIEFWRQQSGTRTS